MSVPKRFHRHHRSRFWIENSNQKAGDIVLCQGLVVCDQRQRFEHGLRHEHSIKRVTMMLRKLGDGMCMFGMNRKDLEVLSA
jgi:ketosteroid isomerase-like protein